MNSLWYVKNFSNKQNCLLLKILSYLKTNSEVEPAEMNGSGKPVGGIEPVNTSYYIINFDKKKEQFYTLL